MRTYHVFWKGCLAAISALLLSAVVTVGQQKHLTAREVISRIQAHVGVPWQTETVDTFKAGNPDEPITGIAVTMMATMDVLEPRGRFRQEPRHYARADFLQPSR